MHNFYLKEEKRMGRNEMDYEIRLCDFQRGEDVQGNSVYNNVPYQQKRGQHNNQNGRYNNQNRQQNGQQQRSSKNYYNGKFQNNNSKKFRTELSDIGKEIATQNKSRTTETHQTKHGNETNETDYVKIYNEALALYEEFTSEIFSARCDNEKRIEVIKRYIVPISNLVAHYYDPDYILCENIILRLIDGPLVAKGFTDSLVDTFEANDEGVADWYFNASEEEKNNFLVTIMVIMNCSEEMLIAASSEYVYHNYIFIVTRCNNYMIDYILNNYSVNVEFATDMAIGIPLRKESKKYNLSVFTENFIECLLNNYQTSLKNMDASEQESLFRYLFSENIKNAVICALVNKKPKDIWDFMKTDDDPYKEKDYYMNIYKQYVTMLYNIWSNLDSRDMETVLNEVLVFYENIKSSIKNSKEYHKKILDEREDIEELLFEPGMIGLDENGVPYFPKLYDCLVRFSNRSEYHQKLVNDIYNN